MLCKYTMETWCFLRRQHLQLCLLGMLCNLLARFCPLYMLLDSLLTYAFHQGILCTRLRPSHC